MLQYGSKLDPFLWPNNILWYGWTYHILLTHLSVDGYSLDFKIAYKKHISSWLLGK